MRCCAETSHNHDAPRPPSLPSPGRPLDRLLRAALAFALTLTLACAPASAQILNLGEPTPPVIRDASSRIVQLRASMLAEAQKLEDREDLAPERREASVALRQFAAVLLDADADRAPERLLWGLTLARGAGAIEALLLDPAMTTPVTCALLARALRLGPADIPADPRALDRLLRDAFAPLAMEPGVLGARVTGASGWVGLDPGAAPFSREEIEAFGRAVEQLAELDAIAPADARALGDLASMLDRARGWPGYEPSAARVARSLLDATPLVRNPPAWLSGEARGALALRLGDAASRLADNSLRERAMEDLARLSRWAALIESCARFSARADARPIQSAINLALTTGSAPSDEQLRMAMGVLELLGARGELPERDQIVRPLRPPYERLLTNARATEAGAIEACAAILASADAMTQGASLAALASHRRSIGDARGVAQMSGLLADPSIPSREPVVDEAYELVARTALEIGRRIEPGPAGEEARASLRALIAQTTLARAMPGEIALREGEMRDDPVWNMATGGRTGDLLDFVGARRASWLGSFRASDSTDPLAPATSLELAGLLAERIMELELVASSASDGASLDRWPGFDVTPGVLESAAQNAPEALAELTRRLLANQPERVRAGLLAYDQRFALLRLLARLERGASNRGIPASRAGADIIVELASGTPDPAGGWMAQHRTRLARIAVWASHLDMLRPGDAHGADLVRYLTSQSQDAMERMAPEH